MSAVEAYLAAHSAEIYPFWAKQIVWLKDHGGPPFGRTASDPDRIKFVEDHKDQEMRLIDGGQPALVRVDAFPARVLKAHVKSVATVASQQDWLSADVKVYQTMISIDESLDGLKPGMSAEVTIFTDATCAM